LALTPLKAIKITQMDYAQPPIDWITGPKNPVLPARDLHLWVLKFADLKDSVESLTQTLSSDELAKARQYRFKASQEKYIIGRAATREILSRYLKTTPQSIIFSYNNFGKPSLNNPDLQFNVSHTKDTFLLAITKKYPVGIDIEHCQPKLNFLSVAKTFCTSQEYQKLLSVEASEINLAFYRCWTRKEAILKAIGHGLFFPFDALEVTFLPQETARGKNLKYADYPESYWEILEIIPELQHLAAIAIAEKPQKLLFYSFLPISFKSVLF
jgi:4'-phosphopantetheinyl transferase